MIHSAYFHGDEQPATELSPRQMQAARRDPASALWIDLDRATAQEEERLVAALGGTPAWTALRELAPTAQAGAKGGGGGAAPAVEVWLEGSTVVTRHAHHPSDVLRRFAARLQPRGGTLAEGARTLLADLAEAVADGYEAARPGPDAAGDERLVARRTAEVELAAAHAAEAFRALAERAPRRGSAGGSGDALDAAVRRLEALAASAGEDADAAQGAAATAGLAAAVANVARQLRLVQTIMLAGLALLAAIAYLLWQIAGSQP